MTILSGDESVLGGLMGAQFDVRRGEADRIAATDRLAATLVRRHAMPHNPACRGCTHRNHKRDEFHLTELLSELGLADEIAGPGDYQSKLEWNSISRTEARHMVGSS